VQFIHTKRLAQLSNRAEECVIWRDAGGQESGPIRPQVYRYPARRATASQIVWSAPEVVRHDRVSFVVAEGAGHSACVNDFDSQGLVALKMHRQSIGRVMIWVWLRKWQRWLHIVPFDRSKNSA
jgi:hypothetical protein